jgi:hypothetical protein
MRKKGREKIDEKEMMTMMKKRREKKTMTTMTTTKKNRPTTLTKSIVSPEVGINRSHKLQELVMR